MHMKRTVSEVARLTGVSVRTLHYYDNLELLKPTEVTQAGYRLYDETALETLSQILFFRELEFPLKEIRRMLSSPDYDQSLAMQRQRELLILRRRHIDALISLVDGQVKGENMKQVEKAAIELQEARKAYAAEAKEKWGTTDAYQESAARHAGYTDTQEAAINAEASEIFAAFAAIRTGDPAAREAQALVQRWQDHISRWHYPCTKEILAGLGQMYVGDQRFADNLDKFGTGTADFMSRSIAAYCGK
jgi:DNA-binding transcriptional MerR regulator